MTALKPQIDFATFLSLDIRTGTILSCEVNKKAQKPAYVLMIDFGDTIGTKTSSAQITTNYTPSELIGKQVVAVVNFEPKRVAGVKSEVLILGAVSDTHNVVILQPTKQVENGMPIS